MKLKNLNSWIAIVAIATIIFTGCKKDLNQPLSENTTPTDIVSNDVNALAAQADNDFLNYEISGGTETEAFEMSNDGLPDAYGITEATADEINSIKRDGNGAGIRKCLHELNLSEEQVAKIRRLFKGYEECNHSIIVRHRLAAKQLLVKYNNHREELVKALRNGRITKAQFEEKMKELRKAYNADREALARKANAALKECYTKMLRGLNQILTERQWKAFVNCYRH